MKGHSHVMRYLQLLEEISCDLCPESVIGSLVMLEKWFSDKFLKENSSIINMEPTELEDLVLQFWPLHYLHQHKLKCLQGRNIYLTPSGSSMAEGDTSGL